MKTVLLAPAELTAVSILAELAVWEKRPELQRLCRSAEKSGKMDEALIAGVLPGLSASACRNLLRTVEYLRLTETGGAISDFGKRCATTGEAPAWELGVFTFLVARHPCFGAWPVAFQRERPESQDRDFASLEEVPAWFSPTPKRVWVSGLKEPARFTISAFPSMQGQSSAVRSRELPPATLVWEIDLSTGKNLLHVEGVVQNVGALRTADMTIPDQEVAALFGQWEPRWNAAAGQLQMPYDGGAGKDGRETFVRSISYKKVRAGARGTFESAKVDGVPVGPSSPQEARDWALALTLARAESADAFVAPTAWNREWEQAITGSPLQVGAGTAPQPLTVLEQSSAISPRVRWLLATPADLSLE